MADKEFVELSEEELDEAGVTGGVSLVQDYTNNSPLQTSRSMAVGGDNNMSGTVVVNGSGSSGVQSDNQVNCGFITTGT